MEIIMLECQKFVFVGCGFMLCTSLCSSLSPLIKPHLASSLSKTCISFASTLLFVLHLVIILSFITLQLYTSQHQFQSLYTPQLWPLLRYFSSHTMLVISDKVSTTHLSPCLVHSNTFHTILLLVPLPLSVIGIETICTNWLSVAYCRKTSHVVFVCVLCVACIP